MSTMTFVEFLKTDIGKLVVHPCIAVPCIECGHDFICFQDLEDFRLSYPKTALDRDRSDKEIEWVLLTGSVDREVRRAMKIETTRTAWDKYRAYIYRLEQYGSTLMPPEAVQWDTGHGR